MGIKGLQAAFYILKESLNLIEVEIILSVKMKFIDTKGNTKGEGPLPGKD